MEEPCKNTEQEISVHSFLELMTTIRLSSPEEDCGGEEG
jgi:hypothetical protein